MKKILLLVLLIATLGILSAACGGGDDVNVDEVIAAYQTASASQTANAVMTETPVATDTPNPTATPEDSEADATPTPTPDEQLTAGSYGPFVMPKYEGTHRHPGKGVGAVECQKTFVPETDWILCEPGVLLDNTAAWTKGSFDPPGYANAPEGGFTYFSMGSGVLDFGDEMYLVLEPIEATNYLVVVRGPLSDGKRDVDRNQTITVAEFVRGHAIWSEIPPNHPYGSAYVSHDWLGQQMVVSYTTGGTNCGSDGCSNVRVVLYDIDSGAYQEYNVTNITSEDVNGDGFRDYVDGDWELVRKNTP